MRIIACYKCVPNDQEISVRFDRTLDTEGAQLSIGRYDLEAVEAAMRCAGPDDEVIALTYAGRAADNSKLRKAVLSRGPGCQYAIKDDQAEDADSLHTALMLKAAIERIGEVSLVLCGEGSEDMYSQQVGPMLGALLGWTAVNSISEIKRSSKYLTVTRSIESGDEILELPLPAVISMRAGSVTPRIPGMKDILAAGKKPYTVWDRSEFSSGKNGVEAISVLAPESVKRQCRLIRGSGEEELNEFCRFLRNTL